MPSVLNNRGTYKNWGCRSQNISTNRTNRILVCSSPLFNILSISYLCITSGHTELYIPLKWETLLHYLAICPDHILSLDENLNCPYSSQARLAQKAPSIGFVEILQFCQTMECLFHLKGFWNSFIYIVSFTNEMTDFLAVCPIIKEPIQALNYQTSVNDVETEAVNQILRSVQLLRLQCRQELPCKSLKCLLCLVQLHILPPCRRLEHLLPACTICAGAPLSIIFSLESAGTSTLSCSINISSYPFPYDQGNSK